MRKTVFADNHFYHIYNRGVEKRNIFLDESDYFRFIRILFEFNDVNSVFLRDRDRCRGRTSANGEKQKRDRLVEIICFCLMPNHFHLLLNQKREGGIVKFMQKLGTGYTMYFNTKNKRDGVLFQGAFKSIPIESDEYLIYLSSYIHLNPVELKEPRWKEEGIKNWKAIGQFLGQYRWSSYPDYLGKKNFPYITNRNFLIEYFGDKEKYKQFVNSWLIKDWEKVKSLTFES